MLWRFASRKSTSSAAPELKNEGTPVYLDVEGLPDPDFYYLMGLRIGHGDSTVHTISIR